MICERDVHKNKDSRVYFRMCTQTLQMSLCLACGAQDLCTRFYACLCMDAIRVRTGVQVSTTERVCVCVYVVAHARHTCVCTAHTDNKASAKLMTSHIKTFFARTQNLFLIS